MFIAEPSVRHDRVNSLANDLPASVQRYFQSLELSDDVSVSFEPVPEPDIDVTPRDRPSMFVVKGNLIQK